MHRYKILRLGLKVMFGLTGLLFFAYQFPKQQNSAAEEKSKLEAELKAFQAEKISAGNNNTLAHFFVSCGGFI